MLGQHPRICLVNEPELLLALYRSGHAIHDLLDEQQRQRLPNDLRRVALCARHLRRLPAELLAQIAAEPGRLAVRDIYERLLPKPSDADLVWGEKSLNNLFFVPDILAAYPEALIVHLVRDARAVALSNYEKEAAKSGASPPARESSAWAMNWRLQVTFFAEQALRWSQWMEFAVSLRERVPRHGLLELRYEDLLEHPEQSLRLICEELGLEYEPRMLDAQSRRADAVLASAHAYAHGKIARELDRSRARSYLALPEALVWIVEGFAGKTLRAFGYELAQPKLGVWERWQARYQWLKNRRRLLRDLAAHMQQRLLARAG